MSKVSACAIGVVVVAAVEVSATTRTRHSYCMCSVFSKSSTRVVHCSVDTSRVSCGVSCGVHCCVALKTHLSTVASVRATDAPARGTLSESAALARSSRLRPSNFRRVVRSSPHRGGRYRTCTHTTQHTHIYTYIEKDREGVSES